MSGTAQHSRNESEESGARYRGLLEAAPDAMVVVNQAREIVLLNAQAESQFGYRRDELLGQRVTNIIPEGFAERIIADGTRSAAEALAQQIGLSGLRKDGSEFPIEIMLSPLESAEGILVTAAIRNISVRKAAETHLAQMEGRYRGLLEAAPDAMVVVNQAGEIVLLNAHDVLLSDLTLPGITGLALGERLRERWPALQVVLMSGYIDEAVRGRASERGWHLLQKPFEMTELASCLHAALDGRIQN